MAELCLRKGTEPPERVLIGSLPECQALESQDPHAQPRLHLPHRGGRGFPWSPSASEVRHLSMVVVVVVEKTEAGRGR